MMSKLKIGALVALVSSLVLNAWLLTRPKPKPEIKTVEKLVTVEKVVTQDREIVKTVTKPDGTKIVTETKEKVKEDSKSATSVVVKIERQSLPRYSLGLEIGRELGLDLVTKPNVYGVQFGYRLWETNAWATITARSNKELLFGFRYDF